MDADAINQSIEDNRQALLRKRFKAGAIKHYAGPDATFDEIPGGMLVTRDERAKLLVVPDGEYGS